MFVEDTVKIALVLDSHHSKFLVLQWEQAMAVILPDTYGRPEPCIYIHTVNDRIFGDSPAKYTVHTPYIHGSGLTLLTRDGAF